MLGSSELMFYCPERKVTRAVAHITGAYYLLEVCGQTVVLREGLSN